MAASPLSGPRVHIPKDEHLLKFCTLVLTLLCRSAFYKFFLLFLECLFIFEREKERETKHKQEGQRERETQNLKQASGSEPSVQSPTRGLNP